MNKLALIGRNIAHSRSPEIYRHLIHPTIQYDLLDYQKEEDIPSAEELLNMYDGINITSPYKKHFLDQVECRDEVRSLGALNCLKKNAGKLLGENTDFLAIVEILRELEKKHGKMCAIILGDGTMSFVTQIALKHLGIPFEVRSRKLTDHFSHVNLNEYFKDLSLKPLVINTCARDYVFLGTLPSASLFWDYNYNFPAHSSLIPTLVEHYIDGMDMLQRQARFALTFWSTPTL